MVRTIVSALLLLVAILQGTIAARVPVLRQQGKSVAVATPGNSTSLNKTKAAGGNTTNTTAIVHFVAKSTTGEIKVGTDIWADVSAESTYVGYIEACHATDVHESSTIATTNFIVYVGTNTKEIPTGTAEERLCEAIDYLKVMLPNDSCDHHPSPESIEDLCR
eukprot:gnl/TRDRNA2_/TRDRNA2_179631_c0_seq1.p1 gnl/TRDRNA2_/TRDRNA2_179631_c0~~gnl/TRDRNA2_/TRDRNA2_179631_c0_seq1.p1  ORF type:complete len:163 (-),score=25.40 gnl/TRDRNA2_/TRDRNA2_179631_c0_seq1:116-604(-)